MTKVKKKVNKPKTNNHRVNNINAHKDEYEDAFSFRKSTIEAKQDSPTEKVLKSGAASGLGSFLNSSMLKDLNHGVENYVHSTNCNISNSLETLNAVTALAEEILTKVSLTMSDAVQHNIALNQELLKCTDVKDMVGFQQKMFESYSTNINNFCLDVGRILQVFSAKHASIFSGHVDNGIKCFTRNNA